MNQYLQGMLSAAVFSLLSISGSVLAAQPTPVQEPTQEPTPAVASTETSEGLPWWRADMQAFGYADNTEYISNPYRDGETLLGMSVTPAFTFLIDDTFEFSLGLFANTYFGDRKFLDPIAPLVRFRYRSRDQMVRWIFGLLDTDECHGLYDQQYIRQRAITNQVQYGSQLYVTTDWLAAELFLDWQRLNTPEHRERFELGVRATVRFKELEFGVRYLWTHEGGQLFASGPITENTTLHVHIAVTAVLAAGMNERQVDTTLRLSGSVFGSFDDPDRDDGLTAATGWGLLAETVFVTPLDGPLHLKVGAYLWFGAGYRAQVGNPVFQTHGCLPYATATLHWALRNDLAIEAGGEFLHFWRSHITNYTWFLTVRYHFAHSGS